MLIARNPKVRYQRDITLAEYGSLEDAISANGDRLAQLKPIAVLSYMGELFELNLASALFWEFIENPETPEEVVLKINRFFEVESSVLKDDILSVIGDFKAAGLVDVTE